MDKFLNEIDKDFKALSQSISYITYNRSNYNGDVNKLIIVYSTLK